MKKVMSDQKYENNAKLKQNYTQTLLIAFKMAYSCSFVLGGIRDFLDFFPKRFKTSTTENKVDQ